jgi:F0F1-type ATP synthase assembly protein I
MAIRLGKGAGETLRGVGALSTVGLAFVLALVIGAWLGSVLDRFAGTSPLFFILFFFFGLAAGILNVYRTVSSAMTSTPSPHADARQPGAIDDGGSGAAADETAARHTPSGSASDSPDRFGGPDLK